MDIIAGLIAAGIGYWIFRARQKEQGKSEAALAAWRCEQEERRTQEEAQRRREQERIQALEAERIARKTPFASAENCFTQEYVSFARLKTYAACPHRFKLIYLDRHEPEESDWLYGRGSTFHSIAEDCLRWSLGDRLKDRTVSTLLKGRRALVREFDLRKAVRFFCRTFPQDAEIVAVEHQLSFQIGRIRFYGIVDTILRYPDGTIELVDYKTGKDHRPRREQLEIYCLPFSQGLGAREVRLRYMLVDRRCHYCWSVDSSHADSVRKHILGLVQTILDDDRFPAAVGCQCKRCGVKAHCPYSSSTYERGSKWVSLRRLRLTPVCVKTPAKGDLIYSEPKEQTDLRGAKRRLPKVAMRRETAKRFDLVQASREYVCSLSGSTICKGDYHFASHHGERMTLQAFWERFPQEFAEKTKTYAATHLAPQV